MPMQALAIHPGSVRQREGVFDHSDASLDMKLPETICFRVTRYCNARCSFCLAPNVGSHPSEDVLRRRVDWILSRDVKTIHFCGGEPTIHPDLPNLLHYAREKGASCKLTTNGILLSGALLSILRTTGSLVKVSLHGDRAHHDKIVGRVAFDAATRSLRRLLDARISASVQTTIVAGGEWAADWAAGFCLEQGVRRLSILPFIPRGLGNDRRDEYGLTPKDRSALRAKISCLRRAYSGRLDIRWLDFLARPTHVVEADGRIVIEGASERMDKTLCRIP
jgi:MoaA/NifB/PqqE/SkfB family radical SAM enzyme